LIDIICSKHSQSGCIQFW